MIFKGTCSSSGHTNHCWQSQKSYKPKTDYNACPCTTYLEIITAGILSSK